MSFAVTGKVVLGCNIHDRMAAHVYVLDTDLFALTAAGQHTTVGCRQATTNWPFSTRAKAL